MQSPATLPTKRRVLDRPRHGAARIISEMSRGAALHLTFTKSASNFLLSNGTSVSTDIALLVVDDVRVVSVGDGLFPTTPQTWRFREP